MTDTGQKNANHRKQVWIQRRGGGGVEPPTPISPPPHVCAWIKLCTKICALHIGHRTKWDIILDLPPNQTQVLEWVMMIGWYTSYLCLIATFYATGPRSCYNAEFFSLFLFLLLAALFSSREAHQADSPGCDWSHCPSWCWRCYRGHVSYTSDSIHSENKQIQGAPPPKMEWHTSHNMWMQ